MVQTHLNQDFYLFQVKPVTKNIFTQKFINIIQNEIKQKTKIQKKKSYFMGVTGGEFNELHLGAVCKVVALPIVTKYGQKNKRIFCIAICNYIEKSLIFKMLLYLSSYLKIFMHMEALLPFNIKVHTNCNSSNSCYPPVL